MCPYFYVYQLRLKDNNSFIQLLINSGELVLVMNVNQVVKPIQLTFKYYDKNYKKLALEWLQPLKNSNYFLFL